LAPEKTRRAIGAIFKPFAIDFQDKLTGVEEILRIMEDTANAVAQVELHAVQAKFEDAHNEPTLTPLEVKRLSDRI
jgi:hypothetical protein